MAGILLGQREQQKKLVANLTVLQLLQVIPRQAEPQQSYSRGARLLEGKLRNRNNFIINKLDIHSET